MSISIHNEMEMAASAEELFNYVSQLNRIPLPMLKSKMEKLPMVALNNLKTKMQVKSDES